MCVSVATGMFYGNVLTTVGPFGKLLSNHDVDLLVIPQKVTFTCTVFTPSLHSLVTLFLLSFRFFSRSCHALFTLFISRTTAEMFGFPRAIHGVL